MKFHNTDGWDLSDMSAVVSMSDSAELTADEKRPFISFTCSAASKVLTLGLAEGQQCIVTNVGGTNAVTVKNISGDTGTSVAAGKVALCIGGSSTADTCVCKVLN